MSQPKSPYKRVRRAFDWDALTRVCEMHETEFAGAYEMDFTLIPHRRGEDDFYLHIDNGSDILAVAHLDTVGAHHQRGCRFIDTAAGPVVYSRALDDRLGAYTILELLPKMGVNVDVLLTVGEEQGRSTAEFFETQKDYLWMIEFDRGGTDVVMYQYEDADCERLVRDAGAKMGMGSFSDIAFLEHLEIKGFNWGVGYRDYHGPRAHAYLEDYWMMLGHFLKFHEANAETYLPHDKGSGDPWCTRGGGGDWVECNSCGDWYIGSAAYDDQMCDDCLEKLCDDLISDDPAVVEQAIRGW